MIINLFEGKDLDGKIGGGWSYYRNIKKGLEVAGHTVSNTDYDISMVCGATMVTWDQWKAAANKPRVLRVDGVPEDFRNRGTGWSRFKGYAKECDLCIFQSDFTRNTTGRLIKKDGPVIRNGVDTSIFKKEGPTAAKLGNPSVGFVYFRNDPNKRFQEVIERFRQFKIDNPDAAITFIGDYPKEQVFWNSKSYDFGMLDLKKGKDWEYVGILKDRGDLASYLRSFDYFAYPSFADPCPNTLIESLACGCKPLWINSYGSSEEIIKLSENKYDFSLKHMANMYVEKMKVLVK